MEKKFNIVLMTEGQKQEGRAVSLAVQFMSTFTFAFGQRQNIAIKQSGKIYKRNKIMGKKTINQTNRLSDRNS